MRLATILSPLTLVALLLRAQAPASKPGSVEGTVVNFATGEPVRKASVRLDSQPKPGGTAHNLKTQSDASGRFHFDSVEPGLYAVGAQRDGYMDPQGRYGIPAPFQVAEEQHVSGVAVKLVPLAVLSGHVQDEDGAPIPSTGVLALRYSYESGRRRLDATAGGQTNDVGEFEILNLAPGRYYLEVAPPRRLNIPVHTRWTRHEEAYPISFYPNAGQISEATPIDVAPDAHVANLDFHLRKAPAYHIRGHMAGQTDGQTQTFDQVMVGTPGTRSGATYTYRAGLQADGSFDIPGVANGSYDVSYIHRRVGKSDTPYPAQSIHVADADVNGVVFTAGPEAEVSGTISVEGQRRDKLNIYVALEPFNSGFSMGGMSAADGSFHIASVPLRVCHLDLRFPPERYYVKSIRFGDREIKDSDIDLSNGADAPLNIVLASDGGVIDGKVQSANGQPSAGTEVTVARSDEYASRADLLKRATTDAAGNFHIKDVAPGDYRVYAWEIDLDQSPRSAEFRDLFDGKSAAVTVGPNSKTSVQVNVIKADDIARERSKLP